MEYSELLSEITSVTGNVPLPTVIRNARNVTIQFCKDTRAYTFTPADVTLTDNMVSFTPPDQTRVWGAEKLTVTGSNDSEWYEFDEGSQVFTLPYTVQAGDVAKAKLVLIPTRTSTGCSDTVMETHFNGIVAGTIAAILMMPKEAWYDPNNAQIYAANYQKAVADAIYRKRNDDRPGVRYTTYGGY